MNSEKQRLMETLDMKFPPPPLSHQAKRFDIFSCILLNPAFYTATTQLLGVFLCAMAIHEKEEDDMSLFIPLIALGVIFYVAGLVFSITCCYFTRTMIHYPPMSILANAREKSDSRLSVFVDSLRQLDVVVFIRSKFLMSANASFTTDRLLDSLHYSAIDKSQLPDKSTLLSLERQARFVVVEIHQSHHICDADSYIIQKEILNLAEFIDLTTYGYEYQPVSRHLVPIIELPTENNWIVMDLKPDDGKHPFLCMLFLIFCCFLCSGYVYSLSIAKQTDVVTVSLQKDIKLKRIEKMQQQ
jgi:hypothetical protein